MEISKPPLTALIKAFIFWAIFQSFFIISGAIFIFPTIPQWIVGIFLGSTLCLILLLMTWLFLKNDDLTVKELGLDFNQGSINKFIISLFIGILFFGSFFLMYLLFTPVTIGVLEGVNIVSTISKILLIFIALGAMEELAFRGYILRKLDSVIGIRAAIYVTSILFGLYHGLTFESITGPAVWGLLYGVLAYWSKGLAVPIGFHVGVNVIQGLVSQKLDWVEGIWVFEMIDSQTLFTIEQLSIGLKFALFFIGLILIEYYLRVIRPKQMIASD